ncbi:MAG: hypothetical protein R6U96_02940 [Promethearchaeia archaeon]
MTSPTNDQTLSLNITEYPQNLLVPTVDNLFSFQATCYLDGNQDFKFEFIGENLQVDVPNELRENVTFNGRETKDYNLKLIPTADGYGKLTININWMKLVEYTVKVQKVRDSVSSSALQRIFSKRPLKASGVVDSFDPKEYIIEMTEEEIQSLLQEIESKKQKYEEFSEILQEWEQEKRDYKKAQQESLNPQSTISNPGPKPVRQVTLEDIDNLIKKVAKAYLSQNKLQKALDIIEDASADLDKQAYSYKLIRANNSIDLEGTLHAIEKLNDSEEKHKLIRKLALDRVSIDPEQSGRIAMLIEQSELKDKLLKDVIIKSLSSHPGKAKKLCYLIENDDIQTTLLFNIAKHYHNNAADAEAADILRELSQKLLNSPAFDLSANDYSNPDYELFKDALNAIAELATPHTADQIIESLSSQPLKEKIAMDLFDTIYKMVDEVKTKLEPTNILSQYYMFNVYSSDVGQNIKRFSLNGGNLSNNILLQDFNFNVIFVSLFSFNFSIFPTFDRIYMDLNQNSNGTFGYFIHPSENNYDKNEFHILKSTLNHFILKNQHQIQDEVSLFNIDFIPYLGKPTAIFSCDESTFSSFQKKVANLGESVKIFRDDSIFKGGEITEKLESIFPSQKFDITNLVFSYEFINNYNIFKSFIQSII